MKESVVLKCSAVDFCKDFVIFITYRKLGDKWALQMAKYQAEYEYAVVGLKEDWNTTLAVLEHYLPMFFRGARQRYWSQGSLLLHSHEP